MARRVYTCILVDTRVYVYTCPCVDLAYSCIRVRLAYWWLIGGFEAPCFVPKSLPWLFRVSSGQSLSKSADGFQPFWVPFGGFEALFCVRFVSVLGPNRCLRFSGVLVGNLCLNWKMVSSRFGSQNPVSLWVAKMPIGGLLVAYWWLYLDDTSLLVAWKMVSPTL